MLILALLLGGLAFTREAAADKVKSNQETKLFARPGERAKVILKVTSGKMMTVLAKEGRWLKVRVSGRTGYVARSTVDLPDEGEIARNTRRRSFVDGRSKERSFGGSAPEDRVGADAVGEGQEEGGGDDEEEEDDPPAKTKPAAKQPTKTAAKPAKPSDDEDEEEDENPLPKGKTPAKPTKVAAKEADEEEDEDDEGDGRKRVKIARKTTMYNEANAKSEAILTATKDTPLFPTGEKSGKFTEVENEEGDLGYILTADIESTGGGDGGGKKVADKGDDEDEGEDGGEISGSVEVAAKGGSQIDLRIRAGVSFLTQGLRSPGGEAGPPNNYNISTAAATLALGSGYYKQSGKKVFGIEGAYDYAKALPGIKVPMGKTTSISLHNLNVRGILGLDFNKPSGMMLLGRLGFMYSNYQVGNVKSMTENTALLPSEVMMAPTIGAALAMPRLTKSVGLRFSVDIIPTTLSYSQTKNLEDGKSPAAKGAVAGIGFTYKWKSSMDISAGYDLTYRSVTFGDKVDASARAHPMGGVKRTDTFHAVTVGIVKAF